jgi:hypothetical protein
MTIEELAEQSLPAVNELLKGSTAAGAYCLGLLCAMAWKDGMVPPRMLLDMAAKCPSPEQAAELYREFLAFRSESTRGDFR